MGFRVGTYGLNFCHYFLKLFLKIEKLISFMGIKFFFNRCPGTKVMAPKLKIGDGGQQKNIQNLNLKK